jgi:hypothetical protein
MIMWKNNKGGKMKEMKTERKEIKGYGSDDPLTYRQASLFFKKS